MLAGMGSRAGWRGSRRSSVRSTDPVWKGASALLGLSWYPGLRQRAEPVCRHEIYFGCAMGFVADGTAGLGYEHGLEWPLVCSGNEGCCGACQADGPLRAWGKPPPLQLPRENAVNYQVLAGHQDSAQPGHGARSSM